MIKFLINQYHYKITPIKSQKVVDKTFRVEKPKGIRR